LSTLAVVLAVIGWTAIALLVAAAARRGMGRGASEFFIGGRRIKGFVSGMTYAATTYSAFMLVGLVGLTYRSGVGALGFEMTYLMFTVLFLVVFGPRFWIAGKRFDYITPPELLGSRYENKGVAVVAAVISLVMLIPYSSVQLIGAGILVEGLSGGQIPFIVGAIALAILSGVTAIWAGMRSVSWTDAVQAMAMIVTSLIAILFVFFRLFDGPVDFIGTITSTRPQLLEFTWSPSLFIGISLPWAFFALTNPQVSQRLFIPDRLSSMRRMILYFAVFGFLYTVISTLFGFSAASLIPGLENPDHAMPQLLSRFPAALALILFIGIFAAASSTLGSIVLTLSSLVSRDVIRNVNPNVDEVGEQRAARITMIVVLAICVGFASLQLDLIAMLSSMASGGLLVMAPAIIAAFFWKRGTAAGALVSMITGGALTALLYVLQRSGFTLLGQWPAIWGSAVTLVLFVVVSAFTRPPAKAADFVDGISAEIGRVGGRSLAE